MQNQTVTVFDFPKSQKIGSVFLIIACVVEFFSFFKRFHSVPAFNLSICTRFNLYKYLLFTLLLPIHYCNKYVEIIFLNFSVKLLIF